MDASMHWESDSAPFHGVRAPGLGTLPGLALCLSSSVCSSASFIIWFNKLLNVRSVSLRSVSCPGKYIEPEERLLATSYYNRFVGSTGDSLDLCLAPDVVGEGGSLVRPNPGLWDLTCSLADCVRFKLNHKTPSWPHRELLGGGKIPTAPAVRKYSVWR